MMRQAIDLGTLVRPKKVHVLYEARRIGETTFLNNDLSKTKYKYRLASGDNIRIHHLFASQEFTAIQETN